MEFYSLENPTVFRKPLDLTYLENTPLNTTQAQWKMSISQDAASDISNQVEDDTWISSDMRKPTVFSSLVFVPVFAFHLLTRFPALFRLDI